MVKSAQNDPSCLATVRLRDEEKVREKFDERGNRWFKIYFGSGSHFRNWLRQCIEIFGEENIEVEEADSTDLPALARVAKRHTGFGYWKEKGEITKNHECL